jgi:hypothetical protein
MKKIILVLLIYPFCFFGQQSFPLIKDGGIWRVANNIKISSSPDNSLLEKSQYLMEGDTTIDNMVYKKIYECDYSPSISNKIYIAGIREDSIGRVYLLADSNFQVFSTFIDPGKEYLLYDFSFNVGDTLFVNDPLDSVQIVVAIDSVMVDGQYRKRWRFNQSGITEREWIKGIGSTKGLFFPASYEFENFQSLTCYEDINTFWLNTDFVSDCFTIGIEQSLKSDVNEIFLNPNPAKDVLSIALNSNNEKIKNCKILDLNGREVIIKEVNNINPQLDISSLSKGIYIIEITTKMGDIVREKFVKE